MHTCFPSLGPFPSFASRNLDKNLSLSNEAKLILAAGQHVHVPKPQLKELDREIEDHLSDPVVRHESDLRDVCRSS